MQVALICPLHLEHSCLLLGTRLMVILTILLLFHCLLQGLPWGWLSFWWARADFSTCFLPWWRSWRWCPFWWGWNLAYVGGRSPPGWCIIIVCCNLQRCGVYWFMGYLWFQFSLWLILKFTEIHLLPLMKFAMGAWVSATSWWHLLKLSDLLCAIW